MTPILVNLGADERMILDRIVRTSSALARVIGRARILLLADRSQGQSRPDDEVAETVMVHPQTVYNVRRRYARKGLDRAIHEMPRPGVVPKVKGHTRWTLRLLADRVVELGYLDSISHVAIGERPKDNVKPWQIDYYNIAEPSARFVAKMEDILDVYERPYDPLRPVICVDEKSKQFLGSPNGEIPAAPGRRERLDSEHKRNGTANIFGWNEPLTGRRNADVTDRRTAVDFAEQIKDLSDTYYPNADKLVPVCDNLNTYSPASLYERYEPAEAHRIAGRIEWHYTSEHGSWLNMPR